MKAITTWFFTGGGSGGDVRVERVYRGLTSLSLKSRTGRSSIKCTIMSVSYHMKLFNKFITTIRLNKQYNLDKLRCIILSFGALAQDHYTNCEINLN